MNRQDSMAQPYSGEPVRPPALHRELRFTETASLSVGVLAPNLAMSVTGEAAAPAPVGQPPSGLVFVLPPGVGLSALALAAVSGFLAFAGFESAGSLGEESILPRRVIPRAIITAVAFGAVFYVACITVQTLGFGTGAAGVSAFRHAQAPLGELAQRY